MVDVVEAEVLMVADVGSGGSYGKGGVADGSSGGQQSMMVAEVVEEEVVIVKKEVEVADGDGWY